MIQDRESFKKCAKARLKTVQILIEAEDWHGAAYMMGYVLEFSLKALICRKLELLSYPVSTNDKEVGNFFKTHAFDRLKVLSGLSKVFSPLGDGDEYQNWSDFTGTYPGDWPSMRYNSTLVLDEKIVKALYNNLNDPANGIFTVIKKRW